MAVRKIIFREGYVSKNFLCICLFGYCVSDCIQSKWFQTCWSTAFFCVCVFQRISLSTNLRPTIFADFLSQFSTSIYSFSVGAKKKQNDSFQELVFYFYDLNDL